MKGLRFICSGLLMGASAFFLHAQKAMTVNDLVSWKRITHQVISKDGQWAACVVSPWRGDAEVRLFSTADGNQLAAYSPATEVVFSSYSDYAVVKQVPSLQLIDSLKLHKTPKEQMPMPCLSIRSLSGHQDWTIDSLVSYQVCDAGQWIAYQTGRQDSVLCLSSLDGAEKFSFGSVSAYGFAKKGKVLYYVAKDSSATAVSGLYRWSEKETAPVLVKSGKGRFTQVTFDEQGRKLAFVYVDDDKKASLWIAEGNGKAQQAVNQEHTGMYPGWVISPHASLRFAEDASHIYLGTAPAPKEKDKHILAENRPNVQVWSGDEPVQYTVQQYNLKKDLKKSYAAVYWLTENKLVQLADTLLSEAVLPAASGEWAVVSTSKPYSLASMWEGRTRYDYYKVSLRTGKRSLISSADYTEYRLSPEGKYAYGYNVADSCWHTYHLETDRSCRLGGEQAFKAWNEENDVPDYPEAYGVAGWTKGDNRLLVYDRYDIWSFNPAGKGEAENLTADGRENRRSYRWLNLDKELRYIDLGKPQLLAAFDEKTKGQAVYRCDFKKGTRPVCLIGGNFRIDNVQKAKDADRVLFTKENFETYPDICTSAADFTAPVQLTHEIRQQEAFKWGTAELVSWVSLDGDTLEGLLFKPADFDPQKKYPMIVNFYERNSETLHRYRMPEAHRSTIDYHLYLSNGYLVFNPDIRYKVDGFPGEDCYNCVMPGISAIAAQGFVDMKHIGAQGHSWGGYQVAYLATRTNLFAAIESGAPVVNMFSAYGGIRWGSGLNRSFQYEHTQSRLGATPWESPVRYFENSPLFLMDKVKTPILIMHNDQDGHVPWYQGIEYFVALKRLQKPVWMLNYTGEPHWPLKIPNKVDFQTRMFQFFNHYLQGAPMPKWMKEGVPAVKQPYELGY